MAQDDLLKAGLINPDSAEDFQAHALRLAQEARKCITIFTPDLEPELYDNKAFTDAALQLISRSRHTEIRILALETKHLPDSGHHLLKLLRYTDTQFQLRKTTIDPASNSSAYLICDDHSVLRRQNTLSFRGVCYTQDRAVVRDQLDEFDLLWNKATADVNLRQLTI